MKEEKGLLKDLKNFLSQTKDNNEKNMISLSKLSNIINEELNELRDKYLDFDLYKELRKSKLINLRKGVILMPHLVSWKITSRDDVIIHFEYNYRCYVEFYKKINDDHTKCDYCFSETEGKTIRNFIKNNYDNVMQMMYLMEAYYRLTDSKLDSDTYREKVSTDLFDITLKIDNTLLFVNDDMLKFKIRLNPNYQNSSELYYGTELDKHKIYSYINKNSLDILDRIYIDVTKLSKPFDLIYQSYINKQKEQPKQLIRK